MSFRFVSRHAHLLKYFTKISAALLVFTINVKVKAISIESPQNCNKAGGAAVGCAIYTESNIELFKTPTVEVSLVRGASVVHELPGQIRLVRGLIRAKAHGSTTISTLYGELKWADGEILVESIDSLVKFTNLSSSDFKYHPRGEGVDHSLPVGFSTYLAKITKSGVAEAGYPHPAEIEPLIKKWSKVYSRSEKSQFVSDLKNFMSSWHEASKLVGPWYLDTVRREIASAEAEIARKARLKALREAEDNKLREMFRERVFEP